MSFSPVNILVLDSVDSTNNYAMAMIKKGSPGAGQPVFAMEQTHGKGRRGKEWKSKKGANVMLSVPLEMQWLPVSRQFELSVAAALACYDLAASYILANLFIKWPNDLLVGDRKAGGILVENLLKGTLWQWTVIGIGLNINQEEFEAFHLSATSFKLVTGKNYEVLKLAGELHQLLLKRIEALKRGHFPEMLRQYNAHLWGRDRVVRLEWQGTILETTITGVSASGQLLTTDTTERKFNFDEVVFRGISGA